MYEHFIIFLNFSFDPWALNIEKYPMTPGDHRG